MSPEARIPAVSVVLAAGEGRRFGAVKQLAQFRERPLIEHAVATAAAAFPIPPLLVLGAHAERIKREADLSRCEVLTCEAWRDGQSASLRLATAHVKEEHPDARCLVVTLGDQPLIRPEALRCVAFACNGDRRLVRADYGGRQGHPVAIHRTLFGEISELTGDRGARELMSTHGCHAVNCGDMGSPVDVDTPEELADLERHAGCAGQRS